MIGASAERSCGLAKYSSSIFSTCRKLDCNSPVNAVMVWRCCASRDMSSSQGVPPLNVSPATIDSKRAVMASARSAKLSGRWLIWPRAFSTNKRLVAISMPSCSPCLPVAAARAMPFSSRSSFDSGTAFRRMPASLKPCISRSKPSATLKSPLAIRFHSVLACANRSRAVASATASTWP